MATLLRFFVCLLILAQAATAPANIFGTGNGKVVWQSDMKKAGAEAKRTGKPILLQLTATWCGYCHKMLKETFTDPAIAKRVNENFVPLLLDADEHEDVVEMLEVTSFPSTIIISSDFEVLGRVAGFQKADAFGKRLADFTKPGHAHIAQTANRAPPETAKVEARSNAPVAAPTKQPLEVPTFPLPTAVPLPAAATGTTNTASKSSAPQLPDDAVLGRPLREPVSASDRTEAANSGVANSPLSLTPNERPNALRQQSKTAAFEGMCLVSMLEDREPTPGNEAFSVEYRGARLLFRDAEQLAKFKAEPAKFWPWFDGRCPVAVLADEDVVLGRPQFGGAYRGRLIFFRNIEHRTTFAKDPNRFISGVK